MSYRIVYGQKMHTYKDFKRKKPSQYTKWIFVMVIIISLVSIFSSSIRQMLLPGDSQITEAAINELADNIKNGESFSDAVTVFCKEILDNA